jgi:uncharacterized protein YutE (UPF0331/DUF86 family)
MNSVEIAIVRRKLGVIIENLKALKPIEGMSRADYIQDVYKRKATERLLQELIEAAIDINTHLIVQTGSPAPDSYYESFIKAGELKILTTDLAEKLAPSAGLRNRLVHGYETHSALWWPTTEAGDPRTRPEARQVSGAERATHAQIRYDLLDHSLVLEAVRTAGDLYPKYVREIEDYLSSGSVT